MLSLIIHEPVIEGEIVWCDYTYNDVDYRHRFMFTTALDSSDGRLKQLLRWLSATHALYLFAIEYFTDIRVEFPLSPVEKQFFEKLTFNGLAEFRQVNHIPMATTTTYTGPDAVTPDDHRVSSADRHGALLLNGGGKDGCVSATLLENAGIPFTWFMLNSSTAQDKVAAVSGKPVLKVKRKLDEQRFEGKYSGHRPTSAAIAICAVITAYVSGMAYVVASNEASANEGNGLIDGVAVNHQYSKSLEFERDFTDLLTQYNIEVTYFSLLRPLHELQIVELFSRNDRYLEAFTSCNHGFKDGVWCLACAKCAFVALTLGAISPSAAERVWHEPLTINRPALFPFLQELLDPEVQKPLECVGTLEECQVAAGMILQTPLAADLRPEVAALFTKHALHDPTATGLVLHTVADDHNIPADFARVLPQI